VTDNLFVGSMFRVFGDVNSVMYRITQVNKFLLFNYHGVKTSEPRKTEAHYVDASSFASFLGTCNDAGWLLDDNQTNEQHDTLVSDFNSMHDRLNRRVTYRIRYEMIPELSPDGTPATIAIDETTAGFDANNEPGIPIDGTTSMLIKFYSTFTSEEQAKISKNPAIFETEPKEDIDLDIFYEASNNQAIFPITNDNKYVYLPIGSTIVPPVNSSFPNGIFISGWEDVALNPAYTTVFLSQAITPAQFNALVQNNVVRFLREDGSFVTATCTSGPVARWSSCRT
jgi:hypothetical protein